MTKPISDEQLAELDQYRQYDWSTIVALRARLDLAEDYILAMEMYEDDSDRVIQAKLAYRREVPKP